MILNELKSLFDFGGRHRADVTAEAETAASTSSSSGAERKVQRPIAPVPPMSPSAATAAKLAEPEFPEAEKLDQVWPEHKDFEEAILAEMRTVRDPEIPVNLVDLGLIYDLVVQSDGKVFVEMTLTSPSCPVAGALPGELETAIRRVPGVTDCDVKLVWTPPWSQEMMTEEARLELGLL